MAAMVAAAGERSLFANERPSQQDKEAQRACLKAPFASSCRVVRVEAVLVEGTSRTRREVVTRELLFEEGQDVSIAQIEEGMQRLRNLALFRAVEYELVSQKVALPDGTLPPDLNPKRPSRVLTVRVDERWTLLPFGSFIQGGGLTRGAVGLFDLNSVWAVHRGGVSIRSHRRERGLLAQRTSGQLVHDLDLEPEVSRSHHAAWL